VEKEDESVWRPSVAAKSRLVVLCRDNKMTRMKHHSALLLHFSNGISPSARNDVKSTAIGQRAGGPLHLKDLPAVPMSRGVPRP